MPFLYGVSLADVFGFGWILDKKRRKVVAFREGCLGWAYPWEAHIVFMVCELRTVIYVLQPVTRLIYIYIT